MENALVNQSQSRSLVQSLALIIRKSHKADASQGRFADPRELYQHGLSCPEESMRKMFASLGKTRKWLQVLYWSHTDFCQ